MILMITAVIEKTPCESFLFLVANKKIVASNSKPTISWVLVTHKEICVPVFSADSQILQWTKCPSPIYKRSLFYLLTTNYKTKQTDLQSVE